MTTSPSPSIIISSLPPFNSINSLFCTINFCLLWHAFSLSYLSTPTFSHLPHYFQSALYVQHMSQQPRIHQYPWFFGAIENFLFTIILFFSVELLWYRSLINLSINFERSSSGYAASSLNLMLSVAGQFAENETNEINFREIPWVCYL